MWWTFLRNTILSDKNKQSVLNFITNSRQNHWYFQLIFIWPWYSAVLSILKSRIVFIYLEEINKYKWCFQLLKVSLHGYSTYNDFIFVLIRSILCLYGSSLFILTRKVRIFKFSISDFYTSLSAFHREWQISVDSNQQQNNCKKVFQRKFIHNTYWNVR